MTGFMCLPESSDSSFPTATEPVNVTSRTMGLAMRWREIADGSP